jgi:AcrR family transcriptional regulator
VRAQEVRQPLTRDRILDAALRLGDEHGIEGVSMRRVARELGVEAMSLYNHVPNKAAILGGVIEKVFTGIQLPDRDQPWTERLRTLARNMYVAFSTHPLVVTLITSGLANPHTIDALRPIEELFAALHDAGFDDRDAACGANALTALLFGTVQLQPAKESRSDEDRLEGQWFQQNVPIDRLPHLHRALRLGRRPEPVADLEFQLDLLITGLQVKVGR